MSKFKLVNLSYFKFYFLEIYLLSDFPNKETEILLKNFNRLGWLFLAKLN